MKHPYHEDVTTESALSIARILKYGPCPKPYDPTPTVDDAIELIHQERKTCGFNWITGTVSEEVLRLTRGEEVKGISAGALCAWDNAPNLK
jgi:hypothetical protein